MKMEQVFGDESRTYIEMLALYPHNASLPEPKAMFWEDEKLAVKQVGKVRSGGSLKIADEGTRYPCIVKGTQVNLFYDYRRWYWYMEKRPLYENASLPPDRQWQIAQHDGKIYVDVLALCHIDGRPPEPRLLWLDDGREFEVDNPSEAKQTASQRAGAVGLLYDCYINGKEKRLFFEYSIGRWFVERKVLSDVR